MEELKFDIHYADGRKERSVVQAARVIIGSGAHCDVRLSPDQAAFEHVIIEMLPDATRVQRLAPTPTATLDGAAFTVTSLGPSGVLTIGGTVIRMERAAVVGLAEQNKLGAAVIMKGALFAFLLGAIIIVSNLPEEGAGAAPAKLPELFPAHETLCPGSDPAEARAVAADSFALADGARERSPFEPREAIAAVKAYDLAAACHRAAGDARAADDASRLAREIEEATRTELRARRVRLERMLAVKDYEVARQDVTVLRALLEGQRSEYVEWLKKIDQDLKVRKADSS